MGDAANEWWWWSDPAGALKTVEGQDLREALQSGKLAPRSLVWKSGWATWYHASTIAELADSIPTMARRPRIEPELDASKVDPPPAPLEKYASYDKPGRIGTRRSSIPPPRTAPAPPRPTATAPVRPKLAARASELPHASALRVGAAATSRPATTPPPPPVRGAAAPSRPRTTPPPPPVRGTPKTLPPPPPRRGAPKIPTPSSPEVSSQPPSSKEFQHRIIDVSATGAEPALPELDVESVFEEDEAPTRDQTMPFGSDEAPTKPRPADVAPPPLDVAPPPPDVAPPPPDIAPAMGAPLPAVQLASMTDAPASTVPDPEPTGSESATSDARPLPPVEDENLVIPKPFAIRSSSRTRFAIVGGVVGVSALVLLVAGISRLFGGDGDSPAHDAALAAALPAASAHAARSASPPPPRAPAAPAKSAAGATPGAACTIVKPATKLAGSVAPGVPLYLSNVPGSSRVAVGYASGARVAVGVTIDPATLAVEKAFHKSGTRDVLGVVPLTTGRKLVFAPDRAGSPLGFAHTIDGTPPFIVGLVAGGFARAIGYAEPDVVWPGGGDERITAPRAASVDGKGHVVAFRRGGRTGEIRVGWLAADGKRKSALGVVNADGPRVGTPSVATNGEEVLITFAARPADDAPWKIRVAHAKVGQVPAQSTVFNVPAGGPGADAISPAAAAPDSARWLLQWTEGTTGNHTVRVQTLDRALSDVGSALTVSPAGKDAGQGAIWANAHAAVAFFLIKDGDDYALWGTGLSCP